MSDSPVVVLREVEPHASIDEQSDHRARILRLSDVPRRPGHITARSAGRRLRAAPISTAGQASCKTHRPRSAPCLYQTRPAVRLALPSEPIAARVPPSGQEQRYASMPHVNPGRHRWGATRPVALLIMVSSHGLGQARCAGEALRKSITRVTGAVSGAANAFA